MKAKCVTFSTDPPMVFNDGNDDVESSEDVEMSEEGSIVSGGSDANHEEASAEESGSSQEVTATTPSSGSAKSGKFELQLQKISCLLVRGDEEIIFQYQSKMVELGALLKLKKAQDLMEVRQLVEYNVDGTKGQLENVSKAQMNFHRSAIEKVGELINIDRFLSHGRVFKHKASSVIIEQNLLDENYKALINDVRNTKATVGSISANLREFDLLVKMLEGKRAEDNPCREFNAVKNAHHVLKKKMKEMEAAALQGDILLCVYKRYKCEKVNLAEKLREAGVNLWMHRIELEKLNSDEDPQDALEAAAVKMHMKELEKDIEIEEAEIETHKKEHEGLSSFLAEEIAEKEKKVAEQENFELDFDEEFKSVIDENEEMFTEEEKLGDALEKIDLEAQELEIAMEVLEENLRVFEYSVKKVQHWMDEIAANEMKNSELSQRRSYMATPPPKNVRKRKRCLSTSSDESMTTPCLPKSPLTDEEESVVFKMPRLQRRCKAADMSPKFKATKSTLN